jgi:hypothetical protein
MNSSSRENESTLPPSAPGTEKRLKSALASAAIPLLRALVRYGGMALEVRISGSIRGTFPPSR